jgi:hypothetical protein
VPHSKADEVALQPDDNLIALKQSSSTVGVQGGRNRDPLLICSEERPLSYDIGENFKILPQFGLIFKAVTSVEVEIAC